VAEFGLAMNRKFKTQAGEDRDEVCFIDCAAFGKQAEVIGQYCTKGKPLLVEGRLKFDQWDDKTSGQKRSKVSVVVENFQFIGDGGQQRQDNGGQGQASYGESQEDRGGNARRDRYAGSQAPGRAPQRVQPDIPF
jgi:single-strand DNA-binding protein